MMTLEEIQKLVITTPSKIVFLIMDGLGGIPHPKLKQTELEAAHTPNLDGLALKSTLGLSIPISSGITPGSGAAHLSLFGYNPFKFRIGRGILEAMGIEAPVLPGDVVARGNFATVDDSGVILDRRAGRIPTPKCVELCGLLGSIDLDGPRISVLPVKDHRFVLLLRGENLSPELSDSDPGREGQIPQRVLPLSQEAEETSAYVNQFILRSTEVLKGKDGANAILLRGFSGLPSLPSFVEVYKLRAAAIATYPMYRGLSRLLGMEVIGKVSSIEEEFSAFLACFSQYDFFFLHIKETDSAGEDGDFERKVKVIEKVDTLLPQILKQKPDVLVVTGDHSTPAVLRGHSWHPVPFLLYSPSGRPDEVPSFSESACARGSLGNILALDAMPLALAHALKLSKFGA
jgi:2,3-bisphosphoglycerate-independent phosphoglycerate mutase